MIKVVIALCIVGCATHDFGNDAGSDAAIDDGPTLPCSQHCSANESCVYEIGSCGTSPSCQPNNQQPCTVVVEACGCDGGEVLVDCVVALGYARSPARTLELCDGAIE
jgi:hypothetical protein